MVGLIATDEALALKPTVEIVSVGEFPPAVRRQLGGSDTDFILSDQRARLSSQRLSAETASFLELFRTPRTLIGAIIEFSKKNGLDPEAMLDDIYPLVVQLRACGVIEKEGQLTEAWSPMFQVGERVSGLEVERCHRALADTEIYRARMPGGGAVALKVLTAAASELAHAQLEAEYALLTHLSRHAPGSVPAPIELALSKRPAAFAVLEWCEGSTLSRHASLSLPVEARASIALRLLQTYRDVHRSGVLHGDVHPDNVVISLDGHVRLIDFGGGSFVDSPSELERVGLLLYYEPEVARAVLENRAPPRASLAGEQFAAAGLAYLLLTGHPSLPLSLESDRALHQIAKEPPRSLAAFGIDWPMGDRVLQRALAKQAADRFTDSDELASAFEAALNAPPRPRDDRRRRPQRPQSATAGQTVDGAGDRLLELYGLESELLDRGISDVPTASLYHGAAGIAYALLRLSSVRNDPSALAAADIWITRALSEASSSRAFAAPSLGLTADLTGPVALLHSVTGLHVVEATVRHLSADAGGCQESIERFIASTVDSAGHPVPAIDATCGAASLLLGCSLLADLLTGHPSTSSLVHRRLCDVGDDLGRTVIDGLIAHPPSGEGYLGFAHGRAGATYSLIRWSQATGRTAPAEVHDFLSHLHKCSTYESGRRSWPIRTVQEHEAHWTGWCHGSAGHLLLWSAANRAYEDSRHRDIAVEIGEHIWQRRERSSGSLCCGLAGQAVALLSLAETTSDERWRTRGRQLAGRALNDHGATNPGLFRGQAGILIAAIEAATAQRATWPLLQPIQS